MGWRMYIDYQKLNAATRKAKMKSLHDQHILHKFFKVGQKVLYTISDYTYFWVSLKVNGLDLSLVMFLKSMGIN